MYKKIFLLLLVSCLVGIFATLAFAQDIQTRGSIRGNVTDPNGAAVAGATVTVSGAAGDRTTTTNDTGAYEVPNLNPGLYTVRITQTGFSSAVANNQTVYVGKATTVDAKLTLGAAAATVEVTAGAEIDQLSTAAGSNLNDQLFQNIPVARGVSGLFYLAPGTTDGLGGGKDNPSISGGSALDNAYIADGVNITNTSFGGIGTFSRVYGALGTGINTSFVKEVQVKTAGFEPQYGQSTGGIINIITQSGGNAFHGAVYGYMQPHQFEGAYKQRDDFSFNKVGELLHHESYDAGVDVGGPILKDKLFFFGSFNPSVRRDLVQGAAGSGLLTLMGEHVQRYTTLNYAGKIDWNIASGHTFAFSIFGDPTKTNKSSFNTLNIDNTTAFSKLNYGSRNLSARYSGTLTSTWTVSAAYSLSQNHFDETGFDNFNQIVDRTGPAAGGSRGQFTAIGLGFVEPTKGRTHGLTFDTTKLFSFFGQHTVGVGFQYQKGYYSGNRDRSGPKYTIPSKIADGQNLADVFPGVAPAIGQTVNAAWSLRVQGLSCTLCPVFNVPGAPDIGLGPGNVRVSLQQVRGEYGEPIFNTNSDYMDGYAQDTWRVNRFISGLAGIRWEQERVTGSPLASGQRNHFTFTQQWAPRLGVTVDPMGKGKMKVYYNFGRFFEFLPLDLAERSLSAEQDFTGGRFAPAFHSCVINGSPDICADINAFGTVNPVYDAAHLLNGAVGGISKATGITASANDVNNPILRGTHLGYLDENMVGFETQLPKNFVFSVRYIDRRIKRIVEDAAVVSPEAASLFGQAYFLGNVNSKLDAAINPIPHVFTPVYNNPTTRDFVTNWPTVCGPVSATTHQPLLGVPEVDNPETGALLGAVCYDPDPNAGNFGSDGIPDGFPDPVHKYRAVEIEFNKRFSDNWQLLANWRIASLRGNYEGHLRNDNGQTDPGISSLFDFTAGEFNLLGDQFAVGPLNSDRRHVINIFGSYSFSKSGFGSKFMGERLNGLNLGVSFHSESGLPISEFLAHPVYLNAGEIPVGGRGKLGRTAWNNRLDLHADYPWNFTERMRLKFVADFFNVTNTRKIRTVNQFRQLTGPVNNVDFLQPATFYAPFNMRLGLRFEF